MRANIRSLALALWVVVTFVLLWSFFDVTNNLSIQGQVYHLHNTLERWKHPLPADVDGDGSLGQDITPPPSSPGSSVLSLPDEAPPFTNGDSPIHVFWRKWSQVLYEHRPQVGKIKLKESASVIKVPATDREPRNPYVNLVRNSNRDIKSMRASHAALMQALDDVDNSTTLFEGYGIAMVGGGEYFGPAITSIKMLRRTGCELPVEVFVHDRAEYESYVCDQYLPQLNASCHVLSDSLAQGAHVFAPTHYQLKSLALLFSSFAHVLFLDSDSMPLLNPTDMLHSEPYTATGMVVWPDFHLSTESPSFWSIAGLSFPTDLPKTSTESGQILLNKSTHLRALLLAVYYNLHGPSHFYPLLSQGALGQGDKETFMAAAVVTSSSYWRVRHPVIAVKTDDGPSSKGTAMLQFLPGNETAREDVLGHPTTEADGKGAPRPAFLHANTPKMNAGHLVDEGDLFSKQDKRERVRLLGNRDEAVRVFGYDVERVIWDIMLEVGCELGDLLRDWAKHERLCERLQAHHDAVFPAATAGAAGAVDVVKEGDAAGVQGAGQVSAPVAGR